MSLQRATRFGAASWISLLLVATLLSGWLFPAIASVPAHSGADSACATMAATSDDAVSAALHDGGDHTLQCVYLCTILNVVPQLHLEDRPATRLAPRPLMLASRAERPPLQPPRR
jgi:hypothetical protein